MSDLPPPSQAPKKSRSGCLLALYIALGLGAVMIVMTGIGIWLFLRSEIGQKVVDVASDGFALVREANQAPGTEALRAAGCSQAMVIPTSKVLKLVGEFAPDARRELPESFADGTLVMCQLNTRDGEGPDCARSPECTRAPLRKRRSVSVSWCRIRGKVRPSVRARDARDGSFLGSLEKQ